MLLGSMGVLELAYGGSLAPTLIASEIESHGRAFLIQPSEGLLPSLAGSRPSGTPTIMRRF